MTPADMEARVRVGNLVLWYIYGDRWAKMIEARKQRKGRAKP